MVKDNTNSNSRTREKVMKAYVEPEEVAMMEKAASNLRDKLLIRTLFHLGCRVTEAIGLTIEDVDFVRGTVIIKHLKSRLKLSCPHCGAGISGGHTFCPKCGAKVVEAIACRPSAIMGHKIGH